MAFIVRHHGLGCWCAVLGCMLAWTSPSLAEPPAAKVGIPSPSPPPQEFGVDSFVQFAVEKNPRLVRATLAIDVAKGRQVQAGLYPNPVLTVLADELGDRTAKDGIFSAQVSQEIVLGKKLRLSQAVVAHEIDQATLAVLAERYALIGSVRANFYEVLALQRRATILADVVKLAEAATAQGQKNFEAKQISRLDVIQLEVELERFRAEADAIERELPAAYRRLAAVVGDPRLPILPLAGTLEATLPEYDQDKTREIVLATHPEVRAAKVGIEKAQANYRRAEAEPIPNVTITGGYVRQYETRSHDGRVGVSIPLPTFNRNQGNISASLAEVGMAIQDVARAENTLAEQVATAFRIYSSTRQRAERVQDRDHATGRRNVSSVHGGIQRRAVRVSARPASPTCRRRGTARIQPGPW